MEETCSSPPFAALKELQLLAAGVAISALVAGASAAQAAECGDLAGEVFGPATITAATSVSPPSSLLGRDHSNSRGDHGDVLPRAGRDQTVRGCRQPNSRSGFRRKAPGTVGMARSAMAASPAPSFFPRWRRESRRVCRLGHRHRPSGRLARCGLGAHGHPGKDHGFSVGAASMKPRMLPRR